MVYEENGYGFVFDLGDVCSVIVSVSTRKARCQRLYAVRPEKNGIVLELNEYAEAIEGKLGAPEEKVCLKEDGHGLAIYGSYGQIFRT